MDADFGGLLLQKLSTFTIKNQQQKNYVVSTCSILVFV